MNITASSLCRRLSLLVAAALTAIAAFAAPADTITLASTLLPRPMKVTVATPGGPGPYPTIYLLNGHGGDYRNWPRLIDVDSLARARQAVVVCPSGMNSWYWDAPADTTMKMESFFTRELVAAIDSLYPTLPSRDFRAITGLSMGGHGALWLALRHPDIWGIAGSTSGGVDIRPFPGSWNMARWLGARDSVPEVWTAHTVRTLAETLPDSVLRSVSLTIDCGTDDFFYGVNCALDSILSARRIPHSFATSPGIHDWRYWQRSIHPQIERFAAAFEAADAKGRRVVEIAEPRMKVFLPAPGRATGRAVVCCPGGGYAMVASKHEGYDWADLFNDEGTALAVVDYRLPGGDRRIPMADIERAFEVLADSAEAWHISPELTGIMGSSAGGHLAATMAVNRPGACRPAFQILFYPVISLDSAITHQGTRRGFLGPDASEADVERWSADTRVDSSTAPALIMLSADDTAVNPDNSLRYFSALRRAGVGAELLVIPTGGHGWGYAPSWVHHRQVADAITAFLRTLKNT